MKVSIIAIGGEQRVGSLAVADQASPEITQLADGSRLKQAVEIANLDRYLKLTYADFFVI